MSLNRTDTNPSPNTKWGVYSNFNTVLKLILVHVFVFLFCLFSCVFQLLFGEQFLFRRRADEEGSLSEGGRYL